MTQLALPLPLSFEFHAGLDTPVDRLDLVFLCGSVTKRRFSQLTVEDDQNQLLFDGIVDEQLTENGEDGKKVTLKCRGKGALLVDNEARPCTYYRLSDKDLFTTHLAPYGFSQLCTQKSAVQYNFVIPKGYSQWDVLSSFCLKSYGREPSVSPQGMVYTYPNYREQKHLVSNTAQGGIRFTRSQLRYQRYGVISRVYLQDNQGYYSSFVDNPRSLNLGILRVRFHVPPTEMVNYPSASGNQKILTSMRNFFTIELSLPGVAPIRKGDLVTFEQDGERFEDYLAGDVSITYNPKRPMTSVTLYDPQYV